jgi:hypothetical protein
MKGVSQNFLHGVLAEPRNKTAGDGVGLQNINGLVQTEFAGLP